MSDTILEDVEVGLSVRLNLTYLVPLIASCSFGQRTESEVLVASHRIYDIVSKDRDGHVWFPLPSGRLEIRQRTENPRHEVEVIWGVAHTVTFDAETLEFRRYYDATYLGDPDPKIFDGPRLEETAIRELVEHYLTEFGYSNDYVIEDIEAPSRGNRQSKFLVRLVVRRQGLRVAYVSATMTFDPLNGRLRGFTRHGSLPPHASLPPVIPHEQGAALCIQAFINRYPTAYLQVRPPELVWWVPERPNNSMNYSPQDESDRLAGRPIPVYTMMAVSHPNVSIAAEPFVDARTGRIIGWDGGPGSFGGGSRAKPLTWDWGSGPIDVLTKKGWRRVEHADVVNAKPARSAKFDLPVTLRRGRLIVTASFDASRGPLRLPNNVVGRPTAPLLSVLRLR